MSYSKITPAKSCAQLMRETDGVQEREKRLREDFENWIARAQAGDLSARRILAAVGLDLTYKEMPTVQGGLPSLGKRR